MLPLALLTLGGNDPDAFADLVAVVCEVRRLRGKIELAGRFSAWKDGRPWNDMAPKRSPGPPLWDLTCRIACHRQKTLPGHLRSETTSLLQAGRSLLYEALAGQLMLLHVMSTLMMTNLSKPPASASACPTLGGRRKAGKKKTETTQIERTVVVV